MSLSGRIISAALQVRVTDLAVSRDFYDRVFGVEAEEIMADDLYGYEPHPGFFFEITKQIEATSMPRFRFGVADIAAARLDLVAAAIEVGDIETIPDQVSWCDFADPDGNPLGLYQDLS